MINQVVQGWRRRHLRLSGALATVGGLVGAYVALEGIWSTMSDKPLVPFVWKRVRPHIEDGARFVALAALMAFAAYMLWTLRTVVAETRLEDALEAAANLLEGDVRAGGDKLLSLEVRLDPPFESATVFASQRGRTIIRNRKIEVPPDSNVILLHLTPRDTRKLRDGYLVYEVTIVKDGLTYVLDPQKIRAIARIR